MRGPQRPDRSLVIERADIKWLIAEQIPHLRRYARALTGDVHQADDLVQDCLEKALRKRRFLLQRSSVRAWAFKILYREFLSRRRRKTRFVDAEIDDDAVIEPARQFGRAHCRDVLAALEKLPDDQRAAVTLVALEDVAYDDAARMLGVPVGTLRSRLSRGRAALRDALGENAEMTETDEIAEGLIQEAAGARPRLRSVT